MFSSRRFVVTVGSFMLTLLVILSVTSPAAAIANWPLVRQGNTGPNVATVQFLLRHHGHSLTADSQFGAHTHTQVVAFQQARGLTADGIVGSDTWTRLVVTLNNDAVRALQTQLNKYGYGLGVDGAFGPGTQAAVTDFKQKNFLGSGSTVGSTTWQALTGGGAGGGYSLPIPRSTLPRSEYDDPHHDYPAIDLPTYTGTSAYAIRGGTVSYVGGGCGYGILISANDGASYKYCHLNSRAVSSGTQVSTGQYIGTTGNTGHSTGPHLHLEVKSGGVLRCPQRMLLAIYDGTSVPSPSSLPTSGCTY
ncbi:MAG: peptidoglycan-binding protein [Chloroflexi bacterium AL-W]|nr:peptidoglycan-binding protein [Chloroflexi bacterium AL-N1]NOK69787.1 peptidoglycan-binding protein [Chloroflexi bacterium AL-N10]NOK73609.1 peptidoglycan-binding protein [Chloroflexi bacterium AL-N5]NOK83957.1 peptidoglycan-binding protein [Chloroflexi bacterium AL-W]NOK87940.1 peptidoglycan-binding protein [Chloroflexi bacterium AL-N15]